MSGYNLRLTLGYVTDGAGQEFVAGSTAYPTNTGGYDFGYSLNAINHSDRSSGVSDPRLAGVSRRSNNGTQSIFAFNTGNGSFDVTLALRIND